MGTNDVILWSRPTPGGDDSASTTCVMVSCCAGGELQIRQGDTIVLRELYPDKSTLYERARRLRREPIPPALPVPSRSA